MAKLVCMDARLDTLSDGHIARRQAMMGGYIVASSPEASKDENDGSGNADDAEDDDDGLPSDDEMST